MSSNVNNTSSSTSDPLDDLAIFYTSNANNKQQQDSMDPTDPTSIMYDPTLDPCSPKFGAVSAAINGPQAVNAVNNNTVNPIAVDDDNDRAGRRNLRRVVDRI